MEKIDLPIEKDNIRPGNPDFKWLGKMLLIVISVLIIGYLVFYIFAYFIIGNISIEQEKELFGNSVIQGNNFKKIDTNILKNKTTDLENTDIYLQDSPEVNAYAVLGGNIIITTGLLKNIDYEEELIFILGHERKHIENRDVLDSLLKDIPFIITMQFLGIDLGDELVNFSKISSNYISKNTELEADIGGIKLINKMGLNLNCSLNFFEKDNDIFSNYLQLVSTHPRNIKRIENIKSNINSNKKCTKFNYE